MSTTCLTSFHFVRVYSGWSRIILSSSYGWLSFSCAPYRPFENSSSILTIRGKFVHALAFAARSVQRLTVSSPSRRAVRMGQHCWLLLATIVTELLVITKWSKDQFLTPTPPKVKLGWAIGATLLVLYPTFQVSSRYLPFLAYSYCCLVIGDGGIPFLFVSYPCMTPD